jgi:hypothetical protein
MKSIRKGALLCFETMALAGLLLTAAPRLTAQQDRPPSIGDADDNFNTAPCDFNDTFYKDNGFDPNSTFFVGRFGSTRQTGPPATGNQVNWVADSTCAAKDPTRRNFRILATTGGNADDGNSPFTNGTPEAFEFISILGFVTKQDAFESNYSRTVGAAGTGGGTTISITPGTDPNGNMTGLNPRGISMEQIVSNFEAYAAVRQRQADGTFATNPCAADIASPLAPPTPCFRVDSVNTVFTPNLRQDWRFATNRNAIDGSDNNCISTDVNVCGDGVTLTKASDSPFGYFCDDTLGMWILTYFWFVVSPDGLDPNSTCGQQYAMIGAKNGFNLDGTPIVLTATELNVNLEANNCAAEGKLAVNGDDQGAVWLVCPALPDPRAGAIALDAFLDQVHLPNGVPQNINLLINFLSLKIFGVFPNELTATQKSQLNSAVASAVPAS